MLYHCDVSGIHPHILVIYLYIPLSKPFKGFVNFGLEKQREYDRMKAREYRARRKAQAAAQPAQ